MLGSAAVSDIQLKLGFRSDLSTPIAAALAAAQNKFEGGIPLNGGGEFMPWFLVKDTVGLVTVAAQRNVVLPVDWLIENEEDELFYYNVDNADCPNTMLIKDDPDVLAKNFGGTGAPQAYALVGTGYRIFPLPDDIYPLQTSYFASEPPFDPLVENKWLKYCPNLLIGEAGAAMAISTRESRQEVMTYFVSMRAEAISLLHRRTEDRLHTNRHYVMGGDD
jgi:hypothetical protein